MQFHLAIAAAARNTLAMELIERCLAQVDRFMSLGVNFGPFQQGATEAHLPSSMRLRAAIPVRRAGAWKSTSTAAAG